MKMIRVTVTLEVEAETVSVDGADDNFEPFTNLVDNLLRDGLEHAEPNLKYTMKGNLQPFEKE